MRNYQEKLHVSVTRLMIKFRESRAENNSQCLRCVPQWHMCIWVIYASQYWASNSTERHRTLRWGWFSIFFTLMYIIQCSWQLNLGQNISMSYERAVEVFGRSLAGMLRPSTEIGLLGLRFLPSRNNNSHLRINSKKSWDITMLRVCPHVLLGPLQMTQEFL